MSPSTKDVGRAAVVAAACVAAFTLLGRTDLEAAAWIPAVALMVVAGAIADRPWVAAVPALGALGLVIVVAAKGGTGFAGWEFGVVVYGALALAGAAALMLGLGLRRAGRS